MDLVNFRYMIIVRGMGKYNLISKVIQCGESSVEEFDNYAKKIDDKEIKNALDKYGIQLHPWNLRGKVMEVS